MSPRRATPQHRKRTGFPTWLLIGALLIVVVVALAVGADWIIKSQGSTPGVAGDRAVGDPRAPIAFVEYSDFQ